MAWRTSPSSSRPRKPARTTESEMAGHSTSVDHRRCHSSAWTEHRSRGGQHAHGRHGVTSLLAALATVGILVPAEWWSGSGRRGGGELADRADRVVTPALLIGFGIDFALLWLALLSGWSPAAVDACAIRPRTSRSAPERCSGRCASPRGTRPGRRAELAPDAGLLEAAPFRLRQVGVEVVDPDGAVAQPRRRRVRPRPRPAVHTAPARP